mgnify:CR=1 FL=1
MEEIIKRYLRKIYYNLKTCALWLFMAVLTGVAVGAFSSAFSFCLKKVTTLRGQYPIFVNIFCRLVVSLFVFLYHLCGVRQDKGTNIIMTAVHGKNQDVPAYMAPLIFAATIITHLFGGSAGREGAALQMGGSIGNTIGRLFKFDEGDRKLLVMSGNECRLFCRIWNSSCGSYFPNGNDQCRNHALCRFSSLRIFFHCSKSFCCQYGNQPGSIYYPRDTRTHLHKLR